MSEMEDIGRKARAAASTLSTATTAVKDRALLAMADALDAGIARILEANASDVGKAESDGVPAALLDRLSLDEERVAQMASALREVAALRDPVGEVVDGWCLPNGLDVERIRVPLGVVGIIYEARPNVTADAAGLCLKSGNAVVLRGSSSALSSNRAIVEVMAGALGRSGLPADCLQLVGSADRETAREMMRLHGLIDALIPRGGADLIRTVVDNSTVPVIETGVGNCHVYVDEHADLQMALKILVNAKTQRPGVCNACETALVHSAVAAPFLREAGEELRSGGVRIRGCGRTRAVLDWAEEASPGDWTAEYLDLVLAVKVVDSLQEAIDHINEYGSGHSDAIVTDSYENAERFLAAVDSSAVYVNASTRFTDGGEFGMGAEIGISTQKLHARGPMSLPELTTTKFLIRGQGQVRG